MAAQLQLRAADGRILTIDAPVRLGRDRTCQIHLDDGLVSRVHATVWPEGASLRVRDEGSSNGTFNNGERLESGRIYNLRAGDTLRIGHTLLTVEAAPVTASPPAAPAPIPLPPSAAERAPLDSPPTVHMAAQPWPAPMAPPPPPPPRRRRSSVPVAAVSGCLIVCLLAVCVGGGALAAQRPPIVQTVLAQVAPPQLDGAGTAPAGATLAPGAVSLTLLPSEPAPTPLPPEAFAANQQSLAAAVAELNQAQLAFIHKALGQVRAPAGRQARLRGQAGLITDADFALIQQKVIKVYVQAGQQGQTLAAQGGGNDPVSQAMADVYAAVAEQAMGVGLKVNELYQGWQNGSLGLEQLAARMSEAGAVLWTPTVTEPGAAGSPFAAYAADPAALPNPGPIDPASLAGLGGGVINPDDLAGWVALAPQTGTATLAVPPLADPAASPLSPAQIADLADAPNPPLSQLADALVSVAGRSGLTPGDTPSSVTLPATAVVVADPTAAAAAGQGLPAFPNGQVTVISRSVGTGQVKGNLLGSDGDNSLVITGELPVELQPPVVALTLSNLVISQVIQHPKGSGTFEGEVMYAFDVTWSTNLTAPRFEIDCNSGKHFDVTTAAGTQHITAKGLLLLYPGAEDAYCYASRNGNTLGSASTRFLVGDAAAATQRADQVETDSVALNITLTADAAGTLSSGQTQAASTVAVAQTANALGTEVAGTQTAEFILTVTALAGNEDAFATQTAAALTGDDDKDGVTNANDRCFDQAESKNGWRDEDGCPDNLPSVNLNFGFQEQLTNGPLAALNSNANLVINFAAGTVTGSLSGSGSWDGTYNCFNTAEPSEIYQIVGGRYTASYEADVKGTADGPSRTYQATMTVTGRTRVRFAEQFTHPECTQLNNVDNTNIDHWSTSGPVTGSWDGNTFATITTKWAVRDISFNGSGSGSVTLTEQ